MSIKSIKNLSRNLTKLKIYKENALVSLCSKSKKRIRCQSLGVSKKVLYTKELKNYMMVNKFENL